MRRFPVLVIAGPTASGKSGLALALAAKIPARLVNADSLQVYDALPLLTAQPSAEDRARAPHALYGVLPPQESCSAAKWREMALAEIEFAHGESRLPIVVGGTGLYLRTLLHGLSPVPEVPPEIRARAVALQKEMGNPAFHALLAARDPRTAARLDPMNTQRNVRAFEVLEATGRPLAEWQAEPPVPPPAHLDFRLLRLLPQRETLYRACDARFDAMLAAGALEEVRAFRHPESAPCRALGYRELAAHLAGDLTLDEARASAQQATRNYAKRQVTWFRGQAEGPVLEEANAEKALALAGL